MLGLRRSNASYRGNTRTLDTDGPNTYELAALATDVTGWDEGPANQMGLIDKFPIGLDQGGGTVPTGSFNHGDKIAAAHNLSLLVIYSSVNAHRFLSVQRPEIYALQILHGNQHTTHSFRKNKNLLILVFHFLQHVQAFLPDNEISGLS